MTTSPPPARLSFDEWLELGRSLGYAGPGWCDTHDAPEPGLTALEHDRFAAGEDPCIAVVRCYPAGQPNEWHQGG